MNRRKALKMFTGGGAGLAATMAAGPTPLQAAQNAIRRGLPPLKITNVKTILTQPAGDQLQHEGGHHRLGVGRLADLVVRPQSMVLLRPGRLL